MTSECSKLCERLSQNSVHCLFSINFNFQGFIHIFVMFLHYFGTIFSGNIKQFQALLPDGKPVSCLEDLPILTRDLKKIIGV